MSISDAVVSLILLDFIVFFYSRAKLSVCDSGLFYSDLLYQSQFANRQNSVGLRGAVVKLFSTTELRQSEYKNIVFGHFSK